MVIIAGRGGLGISCFFRCVLRLEDKYIGFIEVSFWERCGEVGIVDV